MKIEVLYPELSNLYGDYYNAKYLAMCIPDSQTVFTSNNDKPAFLSEKVDIICMGSMSERNQEFAIKHLMPYKDKIKELVENGTFFLATGNSFEIFGKHIEDDDKKINQRLIYIIVICNNNSSVWSWKSIRSRFSFE